MSPLNCFKPKVINKWNCKVKCNVKHPSIKLQLQLWALKSKRKKEKYFNFNSLWAKRDSLFTWRVDIKMGLSNRGIKFYKIKSPVGGVSPRLKYSHIWVKALKFRRKRIPENLNLIFDKSILCLKTPLPTSKLIKLKSNFTFTQIPENFIYLNENSVILLILRNSAFSGCRIFCFKLKS